MYALVPLSWAGRPPVASGLALPSSLSARPRGAGSPQSVGDSQALSCTSQEGELALLLSRREAASGLLGDASSDPVGPDLDSIPADGCYVS